MKAMPQTCALKSGANLIASGPALFQTRFLESLSPTELRALPYLFDFWAMPHQAPPDGEWRSWIILGGRGAGKTRAGAEWVRALAEASQIDGPPIRIALIAETMAQARDVMVFGDSGILAVCPPKAKPVWQAGRNALVWPNGTSAQIFSAFDPESLRGPQFHAAWADEFAKWPKARATWDNLQFALRLGNQPRALVTTTPRNVTALRTLIEAEGSATTHAGTFANAANLAPGFLAEMRRQYAGTRQGKQEIDGQFLEDVEGALWSADVLTQAVTRVVPALDRVVVAVDPPVTGHAKSDACGIVVAGVVTKGPPQDWQAYVLADMSVQGKSPNAWAKAAIAAYHEHLCDQLVAEVNQGGDLVSTVIRSVDGTVPIKTVHASRGKIVRAEPVAALYAQGRVFHVQGLQDLEDEMGQMSTAGFRGKGSPDRVDALVWALTELMLGTGTAVPQVRGL